MQPLSWKYMLRHFQDLTDISIWHYISVGLVLLLCGQILNKRILEVATLIIVHIAYHGALCQRICVEITNVECLVLLLKSAKILASIHITRR